MRLLKSLILAAAAPLALGGCTTLVAPPQQDVTFTMPERATAAGDSNILFWDDARRSAGFRSMETMFAGHEVAPPARPRALPRGAPLPPLIAREVDRYLAENHAAGIIVLQDGKVRHEAYGLGFGPEARWTSFSVAKSFTSTLLGAAVRDGLVAMDAPVTRYLPALAGTAYDGVTVEQLATMTSGVKWNEDYTDPNSDVARMLTVAPVAGESQSVTYARTLTREAPAGEKWVYKTLETNLLGDLVEAATGKTLAAYAKEKIVDPAGFAGPLFWMTDLTGRSDIGGCCLSLQLSDYARFGQFVLEGGQGVVPAGWFARAGANQVAFPVPGFGYGYQWWTYPAGAFGAQGIFGQSITLVPERGLVVAVVSNWPRASDRALAARRLALVAALSAVPR